MTAEAAGLVPASDVESEQGPTPSLAVPSEPTGDTPSPVGENAQLSLLSPPYEPTQGQVRRSDPQPSVTAAKRCNPRAQRRRIAFALLAGREYVTADWLAENDNVTFSHRSTWSARCGQMVKAGLLRKRGTVAGPTQQVTAYELTDDGRRWALDLTREVAA